MKGCSEGDGWVLRLVHINLLLSLIETLIQVLLTLLVLLVIDMCLLCLLNQSSLILKLFPECVRKLFLGHIQIGHTGFLSSMFVEVFV